MTDVTQVNLHNHSDGSLLDGCQTVAASARRARQNGSDAIAFTDHNEVNQHLAAIKACAAEEIHPVLGMEADWVYDVKWTRENLSYPTNRSHICLLAGTDEGLSNIWKLSTLAYTDAYRFFKPLITPELMREYSAGVYASDGCAITEFARAIHVGDEDLARQHFSALLSIYGDRFYSELHTWQFLEPSETDTIIWEKEAITTAAANRLLTDVNQAKVRFATEMGVPLVVVNDSHYAQPQEWFNKELVWRYSTGKRKKGDDQSSQEEEVPRQKADWLMSGPELYPWMERHGIPAHVVDEAIKNSHRIAHSCQVQPPRLDMPRMNDTPDDDLRQLIADVERGFRDKVVADGLDEAVYFARVREELSLVADKKFAGYFLMVADEVEAAVSGRWAPYIKNGAALAPQLVGPGRGSAGGSLIAWLLGITSIDPIHYDLLFERFLAPGRKGFPDIDVDFPTSQRDGEKEYLGARHGHDHVCSIGNITRSKSKGILKDLCRALEIPIGHAVAMSKIVEQVATIETEEGEEELSWAEVIEKKGGDLAPWARQYPLLFEKINEMEGIIRTTSVHASGVVVSNQPLLGTIPMRSRPKDEMTVTQYDMYDVEELGAVKLDLLGLRHLDTLMAARNMIYDRHGVWLDFRRDQLPASLRGALDKQRRPQNVSDDKVVVFGYEHYADPQIWPQVAAGRTAGLFQISTPGLTRTAMDLKPLNERDVAALISIVRPGVKDAGLDTVYLHRRAGVQDVVYDHPMMEPITSETYGVLIYQEQLLRTVRDLAGFGPDDASDLQKALSKKWMDKVVAFKGQFVSGCFDNKEFMGHWGPNNSSGQQAAIDAAEACAHKIWSSIEASGRYAFNKCTSGDVSVRLSGSSQHGGGTMKVADMWRRLHDNSRLEGQPCWYGCTHTGYRGQCQTCRVWRQKFCDSRGLKAWSLGDDGRLHPNRIMDVHQNGVQPVWKVTLEDGRSITATANHRHMTPDGWREVWELSQGDELLVCGEYEGQVWEPQKVRTTMTDPDYHGARLPNHERVGTDSLGYRDGGYLALKEWTGEQEWVCSESDCTRSREAGDRIERAHLDGDRTNNDPSNLAMKCASHHKAYDYQVNGRRIRGEKGYPVIPTQIVSIGYAGEEMTYDLEMADPYHSWVGDDIVTHNSHAVGYAIITTWETWTKHYYPEEFLVACMATDSAEVNRYLREARQRGIKVLPPDVNESARRFTIGDGFIRYGLDTIRGVGDVAVKEILAKRPFTSLSALLATCDPKVVGKTQMEALISIGAMDDFRNEQVESPTMEDVALAREQAMTEYQDHRIWMGVAEGVRAKKTGPERAEHIAAWRAKHATEDRFKAKYLAEFSMPNYRDPAVLLALEQELVGNYVFQDPMDPYIAAIESVAISDPAQITHYDIKAEFVIGGQLTKVKTTKIKKEGRNFGKEMAFINISWLEQDFEITAFPDAWEANKLMIVEGAPVVCAVVRDNKGCNLKYLQRLDTLGS